MKQLNLVKEYLKKRRSGFFFINRRGFAPYLICKKCGINLLVKIAQYI